MFNFLTLTLSFIGSGLADNPYFNSVYDLLKKMPVND